MRITQSMTNRRYMSQLNAALERKNASERKINSLEKEIQQSERGSDKRRKSAENKEGYFKYKRLSGQP